MTDQDKIELPPLPPFVIAPIADEQTVRDYARAAVLADRERRAEQAQPAKPKVHSLRIAIADNGSWTIDGPIFAQQAVIDIHWTTDGRAWIESEKNANIAVSLRSIAILGNTLQIDSALRAAADALDGGVR